MEDVSANNPLEIPEILENVFQCLPLKDLKSCRLVSKFWRDYGIAPMKRKEKIGVWMGYEKTNTIDDLAELSKCLNSVAGGIVSFPCSKFFFSPSLIRSKDRKKDELVVADFLQKISPLATELWLSMDLRKRVRRAAFPQCVDFPKLKMLEFSAAGIQSEAYKNSSRRNFYQFVTDIVAKAPVLQTVNFMDHAEDDEHSVDAIIKAKSLSFTELQIYTISNITMERLCSWNREVKLKSLDLGFIYPEVNSTNLLQLLRNQNDSLEKLVLGFSSVSSSVIATFPEMPKLKNLTIQFDEDDDKDEDDDDDDDEERTHDLITFPMISYQRQFPALKALHLNQWNSDEIPLCKQFITKDMQPIETLEELSLPYSYLDGESVITAQNAVRIFPSVKKLTMQADSATLPTIFEHWTNLEHLTLLPGERGCIDYLLMGHSRSEYKRIQKRIQRERNDFDWNQLEPGNATESIVNLQKLRVLTFLYGNGKESQELEVTLASLHLILSRISSLRCVDFGCRGYPMETKIDKTWWAERNEDCVALWNNIEPNKRLFDFS